ncbi:hypothetical protein ACQR35_12805 [Pseudarthrobacter sp. J1738]|uniref:hypothetical protein n=1 Tax=unclassified Pseudarthrobacter TaxID=2647000 RepID=UPI003D27E135
MKWLELVMVAGATLVSAMTVVVLYSLGVRLTAISTGSGTVPAGRQRLAKFFSIVCFAVCGLAVLFGIYLIVPYFSK